jgi:glutamine amidotransferase
MALILIDYGAGNLRSAAKALEAAGAGRIEVSADPARIASADRLALPGVGAFGACVTALRAVPGLEAALDTAVRARAVPFLGICVGMQLMAREGHEFGVHRGLGWIPGTVRRLAPADPALKVPQIGWNRVDPRPGTLLADGYAYFVHSYAMQPDDPADIVATADYGGALTAAVQRDNMLGVQFHPEKSQAYGLSLLARWLMWKP